MKKEVFKHARIIAKIRSQFSDGMPSNAHPSGQNLHFYNAFHVTLHYYLIPAIRDTKLTDPKPVQAFTNVECHLPQSTDFQQSVDKLLGSPIQSGGLIQWFLWKRLSTIYNTKSNRGISCSYSQFLGRFQNSLAISCDHCRHLAASYSTSVMLLRLMQFPESHSFHLKTYSNCLFSVL